MPEKNGPGKEPPEKRRFISEKIIRQPMSKGQIARRLIALCLIAVLFGVISAVSFVISRPWAEHLLGTETTEESSSISIPKDEPDTTPERTEPTTTMEETEPIEDMLQTAIEKYKFTIHDFNSLYSGIRETALQAGQGIVMVHSVQQETDWFDNPVETTGLYAGAVIAYTRQELIILTPEGAVESADSIKVTFSDGSEANGYIKQFDRKSGMAIVAVGLNEIKEETLDQLVTLALGNSYTMKQGDVILAIGSPVGIVYSFDFGIINCVRRGVQVVDGSTRLFYSDVAGNGAMGTFLINTDGEIIGWVTEDYQSESTQGTTVAMAISDYKGILEKMTNGIEAPYFGIKGQEVAESMVAGGMPSGLYVTSSIADSPAYNAGIQNGDIITRLGGNQVTTVKDFQNQVESFEVGAVVMVTVQRYGRESYTELEYQVTIGAR